MFEQSIVHKGKSRKPWAIALAMLVELGVVGLLVLIPLIFVQAIPMPEFTSILTLPAPPPPPPPPPPAAMKIQKAAPRHFNAEILLAPRTVPQQAPVIVADAAPSIPQTPDLGGVPGGVPGGVTGGVINGIVGSVPEAAPPPVPLKPEAPATPSRIHVGGNVEAAMLTHEVEPVYPKLASEARIGGQVRLKAVIDKDGHIKDLSLISGHPLLVPSAMNAVRQWVYRPTYLNGNPVEVDTEIDVTFALST
jgi:periplasmic protein TonB